MLTRLVAEIDGAGRKSPQYVGLALGLYASLALVDSWALGLPYSQYFRDVLAQNAPLGIAVRIAGALAICGLQVLFLWAAVTSTRGCRLAYWMVFTVVVFVQYGYVRATGAPLHVMDIVVAASDLLYWPAMIAEGVNWLALVPITILGASLVLAPVPRDAWGWIHAAGVVVLTLLVHTVHVTPGLLWRSDTLMPPAIHAAGTTQAFARVAAVYALQRAISRATRQPRIELPFRADAVPTSHVVLVIDEAVRADRLSLYGYERPTTPWLDALYAAGRVTRWESTAAAAYHSNPAVASILLGIRLPARHRELETSPTIFQYAKAMNYRTRLFGGQVDQEPWGLTLEDMRYIDDFRGVRAFGGEYAGDWRGVWALGGDHDTDMRIAAAVREALAEPEGQFIVVLKRGNHFPYTRNVPESERRWTATDAPAVDYDPYAAGEGRSYFIDWRVWGGAYDDGLRYSVDEFFRTLLGAEGALPRTVLLYTSDHGQPYWPETPGEFLAATTVPLLMFGENRPAVDTGYRASHHNIFATILDLIGYPGAARPLEYGRSLLVATASDRDRREVFNGDPFGVDEFIVTDYDAITK